MSGGTCLAPYHYRIVSGDFKPDSMNLNLMLGSYDRAPRSFGTTTSDE